MAFRLSSGDVTGFKVLFSMAIMYGLMAVLVYSIVHMHFITPLGIDAPLDRFSEGRALQHLRVLSQEIGSRQEGSPGLKEAARYIKAQLEVLKERAGSNIRIEIEETIVDGSFNMIFLGYSISLGYRNHTNVIMRISSVNSQETDPSVLLNGHFDSPLGSPGAGDCGSCVASMLEMARLTVDSGWVPLVPLFFFLMALKNFFCCNGVIFKIRPLEYLVCSEWEDVLVCIEAEYIFSNFTSHYMFCQQCSSMAIHTTSIHWDTPGAHGFMKTHKWSDTIGAFINIEASGTGGLDLFINLLIVQLTDLVCQSGPGSWPSLVYAQSAVYPMAHSAAQVLALLLD
ncbi:putative endoplasmic reticulum metallopeptidase 1 [Vitis vinifera]|uniref:Putative endoplasmic reticulum metallopeptidase 1 n=1 Tax=Vitis vinifera TaxID=29760 RepID=A0A438CMR6_VITVI|nr:putative endoplasmic reticulum metallopeptidase 1 [Vitis vinifera]